MGKDIFGNGGHCGCETVSREVLPQVEIPEKWTQEPPCFAITIWCAIKIAHQWAQFSLRFWHFWWVSSLFQWLPTISKPVLSISLIVGRLYIRISLTTRENTLVARDGEGFMEVAMLLHVLMFCGLLARPAGRWDWPAENYPVRTSRVMRKAGAARRRLAEKLAGVMVPVVAAEWHMLFNHHIHNEQTFT